MMYQGSSSFGLTLNSTTAMVGLTSGSIPFVLTSGGGVCMQLYLDKSVYTTNDLVVNTSATATNGNFSLIELNNRLKTLETTGGGVSLTNLSSYAHDSAAKLAGLAQWAPYCNPFGLRVRKISNAVNALPYSSTILKESKHSGYTFGTFNAVDGTYTSGQYTSWGFNPDSISFSPNQTWKTTMRCRLLTANVTWFHFWFGPTYTTWSANFQPQTSAIANGFKIQNNNTFNSVTNFTMTTIPAGFWASLGVGFYLTISRNTAGILNVRFEDLNGTTGVIMNRGLVLEAGSNSGSWSNWHDAFGPVLNY